VLVNSTITNNSDAANPECFASGADLPYLLALLPTLLWLFNFGMWIFFYRIVKKTSRYLHLMFRMRMFTNAQKLKIILKKMTIIMDPNWV
jgi:hypothetical protein